MQQLIAALASDNKEMRLEAVVELCQAPEIARPLVVELLSNPNAPRTARIFALITLTVIGDDELGTAAKATVACLNDPQAILRRCALDTLGQLKVSAAVGDIAKHLTDDEVIPEAWFGDTSLPSHAARRALETIGTPEALAALR